MNKVIFSSLFIAGVGFLLATPLEAVEYTGRSVRDPFDSANQGMTVKDEIVAMNLSLEGLVWNSDKPRAIINGQIVKVGQKVVEAEVLDIKKDGVKMRYKGMDFYLRLRKETA